MNSQRLSAVSPGIARIERDLSKPDGTPRKLMSADKLRAMGWSPSISLEDGIEATYRWFLENIAGA